MTNLYKNISASAQVKSTAGTLRGMYVNSTNVGTIQINDGDTGTASAGVKATQTITASGVFSNNDTITVDTLVYTMKTTLSTAPTKNEILIGASAAASLDNIKSAINASGTEGTTYGYGTGAHPTVTATTNADTTQVVEAILVGVAGNSIATTETGANSAWGSTVLTGGADVNILLNNTITPAIGYHDLGNVTFSNGLYATKGGTAIDVTIYYQ